MLYLISLNDIEKAEKYLKEAAYSEFPFGQNNLGLLYQFHLKNMNNAIHFFGRSSEHNFSLSFYNLGHYKEKVENDIEKAVEFYLKASEFENEKMNFQHAFYEDESLNISKIFILCFTNLKLVDHFLSKSEINKSKEYFIKAFSKLYFKDNNIHYKFHIKIDNNSILIPFSYLKKFILNFPPFNLKNQSNLNLNNEYFDINDKNNSEFVEEFSDIDLETQKDVSNFSNNLNELIFEDAGEFFDFVVQDYENKVIFINEIKSIIQIMETILYTHPYSILFGRINIEKTRFHQMEDSKSKKIDINESFYEGFGL